MSLILFRHRHWKLIWVSILVGIITAHVFFMGLQPWSGFVASMVIWSGQDGQPGLRRQDSPRAHLLQSNLEKGGTFNDHNPVLPKHGLVKSANRHYFDDDYKSMRDEYYLKENMANKDTKNVDDRVVVGAGPYLIGGSANKKAKNKQTDKDKDAISIGTKKKQVNFVKELDEDPIDDTSEIESEKVMLPRPGERYKEAVYYLSGEDQEELEGRYIFDDDTIPPGKDYGRSKASDEVTDDSREIKIKVEEADIDLTETDLVSDSLDEKNTKNEPDKTKNQETTIVIGNASDYVDKDVSSSKNTSTDSEDYENSEASSDHDKSEDERIHPQYLVVAGDEPGHAQKAESSDRGRQSTKLILLTYMRSGSSYVGSLLERSPDVFYFYEPLYSTQNNFGHWDKFRYLDGRHVSETSGIDSNSRNQQNRTRGAPPAFFRPDSIAVSTLKSALDCRVYDLDLETLSQVTMGQSVTTADLKLCAEGGSRSHDLITVRECCTTASETCRRSLTVVAKVIRLSMVQARVLMEEDENVRLVHLIRDPRGMSLSQVYRRFYPWEFHREVVPFCERIWSDVQQHAKLAQEFPFRTLLVRYEDVVHKPILAIQQIYDFAGIKLAHDIRKQILRMSRNKGRPYKWRDKIGAERATVVEKNCAPLFHVMGYREFPDKDSVTNRSFFSTESDFAEGWPGAVVRLGE